jgi:hypothetical protein
MQVNVVRSLCTAAYRLTALALLATIASELAGVKTLAAGIFLLLYKTVGGPVT